MIIVKVLASLESFGSSYLVKLSIQVILGFEMSLELSKQFLELLTLMLQVLLFALVMLPLCR